MLLGTITSTTNSIRIPILTNEDLESDIRRTTCKINNVEVTIVNNECTKTGLTNSTSYTYEVETENNAGLKATISSDKTTASFGNITISESPASTNWTTERTLTLTGSSSGTTLEYKIDSGSWTTYSTPIKLTSNVSVYARLSDGVNVSDAVTYAEDKIDTTKPELLLGTISTTTKSITIPITTNRDLQSDIKRTTCKINNEVITISNGVCEKTGLTNSTSYTYEIETENNAGLVTTISNNQSTSSFGSIAISPNTTGYALSRTITLGGAVSGQTLEYKIGSGSWTTYSGPFTINSNTTVLARITDGVNITDSETYTEDHIDTTGPSILVNSRSTTTSSITVEYTTIDSETGVGDTNCLIPGSNLQYGTTVSLGDNKYRCTISGLTKNTKYTYNLYSSNGLGLTVVTQYSNTTDNFTSIAISPNTTGWAQSRTITLSGSSTGSTLEYKIGSGSWTTYSSAFTLTSNDTVYARFNDGTNTSEEETYTESQIDRTTPTITYSVNSSELGSNSWYRSLVLKASIGNIESGTNYVKYCVTTSSTCTPSDTATLTSGYFTVTMPNNTSAEKLCVQVKDGALNESGVECSSTYQVDTVTPTLTIGTTSSTANSITIPFTRTYTGGSGIKSTTCKTTSPSVVTGSVSGTTCTISGLSQSTTYSYEVYTETNAGKSTTATGSKATISSCGDGISSVNGTKEFAYTGSVQTFTACAGRSYKLEVWGAQGGTNASSNYGGYGGYSYGEISVSSQQTLYIYVGGQGSGQVITSGSGTYSGGYNGGGTANDDSCVGGGGGGATHIATETGLLSALSSNTTKVLIVAGGGGGSTCGNSNPDSGGHGGGYIGGNAYGTYTSSSTSWRGNGGTQSSAGTNSSSVSTYCVVASFGLGGTKNGDNCYSGGGGGYYGGSGGWGGGGGSGYIGNSSLTNKGMYMYTTGCNSSTATATKTTCTSNVSSTATANYAKSGSGYARITRLN